MVTLSTRPELTAADMDALPTNNRPTSGVFLLLLLLRLGWAGGNGPLAVEPCNGV